MEANTNKIYKNAFFYKKKGYGTFIEIFFIKIFSSNNFIFRDYPGRKILSKIAISNFKNYKDIYLSVDKSLDKFYSRINLDKALYKGVNIPFIARRELHCDLSELLNNFYQLKCYQTRNNIIYKVEYESLDLLRSHGIACKASIILTCLYFLLDSLYFIYSRIRIINPNVLFDFNLNIKKTNKDHNKTLLSILTLRSSNTTFLKLLDKISDDFKSFWIKPELENKFSKEFTDKYTAKLLKEKRYPLSIKLDFIKSTRNQKEYELQKYLATILSRVLYQNKERYKIAIDIIEEALFQTKPDGVLVGLNHYWIYNISVQLSKLQNTKVIYVQDVFMGEDIFFDVSADHALLSSKTIASNLKNNFNKKESEINVTSKLNELFAKSSYDLIKDKENYDEGSIIEFKKKEGINSNKKIILFIGDPGELYNSKEQKYYEELDLLKALKDQDKYFLIIKVHPSDTSDLSNLALDQSNNKNAMVSKDINIYECMKACDVVISKSSTAVLEAMILKKFILLYNVVSHNLYKKAVDYGLASYIDNENDILSLLNKKDNQMEDFEVKMHKYFEEVYSSNNKNDEDIKKILKRILNNE